MSTTQLITFAKSDQLLSEFKEFEELRVYGTPFDPLFIGVDVQAMLGLKDEFRFHRDFEESVDYIKIKIVSSDNRVREVNAFTEQGLYRVIFSSMTDLGKKFRKFVSIVLHELRINKAVTLETALDKLQTDYNKNRTYIKNLEEQVDEEHAKVRNQDDTVEKCVRKMRQLELEMQEVQARTPRHASWGYELLREDLLMKLKNNFLKKVYIQSIDPPKELEKMEELERYKALDYDYEYDNGVFEIHAVAPKTTKKIKSGMMRIGYVISGTTMADVHDLLTKASMNIPKTDGNSYKDRYYGTMHSILEILDKKLLQDLP
jgi:prophage antirepressor-like protein